MCLWRTPEHESVSERHKKRRPRVADFLSLPPLESFDPICAERVVFAALGVQFVLISVQNARNLQHFRK